MKSVASTGRGQREVALIELGTAVASTPCDVRRIQKAAQELKNVGGIELCVEAAAVCGAFESITKLVDATGRGAGSSRQQKVMQTAMTVMKHRNAILLAGVSVAAAILARRKLM